MGEKTQSPGLSDLPKVTQLSGAAEPGLDPSMLAPGLLLFIPVLCCLASSWNIPWSSGSPRFCTCFSPCKTYSTAPLIRSLNACLRLSRAKCHFFGEAFPVRPVLYGQIPSYSSMFQEDLRSHICKGLEGPMVSLHHYGSHQALAPSGSFLFSPGQRRWRCRC